MFSREKILITPENELSYGAALQVANLTRAEWSPRGIRSPTPLDMGGYYGFDFASAPHNLLARPGVVEILAAGPAEIDGQGFDMIATRCLVTEIVSRHFLEPTQGHLPRRIERYATLADFRGNKIEWVTELLKVRSCSGDRFFPEHIRRVQYQERSDRPAVNVMDVLVLELDVDRRPSDTDFEIELPARTQVRVGPNGRGSEYAKTFYYTKQTEKVNAADIEGMYDLLKKVQQEPFTDTAISHRSKFQWLRWSLIAAAVGALICAALRVRWRWRTT
jgi:hypothetical protein